MENASKALIIAGEMLIAMLIVSLLLYAWTSYSKYKKNQIDLDSTENISKLQKLACFQPFTNYIFQAFFRSLWMSNPKE